MKKLLIALLLAGCSQQGGISIPATDLLPPDCPPPECADGTGLTFCVGVDGKNLETVNGLLCAHNAAITTRCIPVTLDGLCKHEIAYLGFVELVPQCSSCD